MTRILAILIICFTAAAFGQHEVTLGWSPSPDQVVGYKVYYGPAPRFYTNQIDCGSVTNCTVSNLVAGASYYFAATAYTATGVESDYSNEATYTVKPFPPVLKTPYVTLSWGGPWRIETSTNLLAWSPLVDTPFNMASFPIEDGPQKFFRISAPGTNFNVRINASPQL